MSDFHATGAISRCSELRQIRRTDIYNQDPDDFGYEIGNCPVKNRFKHILLLDMTTEEAGKENITISLYDDWAKQCQFITVGDMVTITVNPELVRYRERDETHCVALHVDEDDNEATFIVVNSSVVYLHMCSMN